MGVSGVIEGSLCMIRVVEGVLGRDRIGPV